MSKDPHNQPGRSKVGFFVILAVGIPAIAIAVFATVAPDSAQNIAFQLGLNQDDTPTQPVCRRASLNMQTGSRLYLDEDCSKEVAVVLGERRDYPFPDGTARAVKLSYPGGSQEWKRYEDIGQKTFVNVNDPTDGELRQLEN